MRPTTPHPIPLSLYIHMPWCVKKCPYCDFNSHALKTDLPEQRYINRLIEELQQYQELLATRSIYSIFIGGGTPSLFSANAYTQLFTKLDQLTTLPNTIEITMEANPGAIEHDRFSDYLASGINRLSLGIQSFQADKLKVLGRIHSEQDSHRAIDNAKRAGFNNINLDLMYGLPQQTHQQGLADLKQAIQAEPTHISWYQLTLEPNTYFYRFPPTLPSTDDIVELEIAGRKLLSQYYYQQYEVSAYATADKTCQHNLNYWTFGDYLGIGAGAHSKITDSETDRITRHNNYKNPRDYLDPEKQFIQQRQVVDKKQAAFEFMLNALRLKQPIDIDLFTQRTLQLIGRVQPQLAQAVEQRFIHYSDNQIQVTELGQQYLNDLTMIFL